MCSGIGQWAWVGGTGTMPAGLGSGTPPAPGRLKAGREGLAPGRLEQAADAGRRARLGSPETLLIQGMFGNTDLCC